MLEYNSPSPRTTAASALISHIRLPQLQAGAHGVPGPPARQSTTTAEGGAGRPGPGSVWVSSAASEDTQRTSRYTRDPFKEINKGEIKDNDQATQ